jgi:hypothetical protein
MRTPPSWVSMLEPEGALQLLVADPDLAADLTSCAPTAVEATLARPTGPTHASAATSHSQNWHER